MDPHTKSLGVVPLARMYLLRGTASSCTGLLSPVNANHCAVADAVYCAIDAGVEGHVLPFPVLGVYEP